MIAVHVLNLTVGSLFSIFRVFFIRICEKLWFLLLVYRFLIRILIQQLQGKSLQLDIAGVVMGKQRDVLNLKDNTYRYFSLPAFYHKCYS